MEAQLSPTGRFEKILLATDRSEFSTGAERLAIALAKHFGAKLFIVTVVITNDELAALAPQMLEQTEAEARAHLDKVSAEARRAGVTCEDVVRRGYDPAQEIVDVAEASQVDVIVVGRRGRRGLARVMLGDATVKVIGRANCSVLVAPRAAQMWRRRILLATDGSRYSDAAAIAAGNLARGCDLPLTVVSVTTESHSEQRRAEARQAVDRVAAFMAKENLQVETIVGHGKPDEVIIETAANKAADLIVVGSHGRTGLKKILVGSIAERVLNASEWPVLVAKT